MGVTVIRINKKDDSTIFGFERTWIEFYPALYGKVKKKYISEVVACLFINDSGQKLYEMFKNNEILNIYREG